MKRVYLCLLALLLMTGAATAQVVDPGWAVFAVRGANVGGALPTIVNDGTYGGTDALLISTAQGGQKVALGTNLINGVKVSQIATLHIDRIDPQDTSWSLYGPYFNIWVTDGLGHYAVIANEPSNPEWAGSRWDVPDWDFLKTKTCKVYETPGLVSGTPGTSWVATAIGISSAITFEDVGDLIISPPPPSYITNVANAVGSGAPDELGTNVAYGYNWVFGDTQANYTDAYVVDNYSATASYPVVNVTQSLNYTTIEAALAAANANDLITVAAGSYSPPSSLHVNIPLQLVGAGSGAVTINIPAAGGYGFEVHADDVTLSGFTLATNVGNPNYPIHASGTTNPPGGYTGLTLTDIVINGVHQRAGFDIHGYSNVVMTNCSSSDATGGNGVQLTGVIGATLSNITTLNNAWGSISIYCSNASYLNRASDNINIDGDSCSLGENNVFQQDEFGLFSTNVTVTGYEYLVQNAGTAGYFYFQDTLADAIAFAVALDGAVPGSYIRPIAGGAFEVGAGMMIQPAIDAASPGDAINVHAGHFEEQLHIAKNNLTITGAGAGSTFVDCPPALTLTFATPGVKKPIVFVDNSTGLVMSNLTVDGLGRGNANNSFVGVGFWNAGGTLSGAAVLNVRDTPFSGVQHGVAIYAYNNTGGPYTVAVSNVQVLDFQKNAFALSGEGLTVNLDGVDIVGAGPTLVTAQNGIQVGYGASGTLSDCTISSIDYTDALSWASAGVLLYNGGNVVLNNVDVASTQSSFYCQDTSASFDLCDVTTPTGDALYAYSTGAKSGNAPRRQAQPMDPGLASGANKAAITVNVSNGTFVGSGVTGSWGPSAYGTGPITFNVDNCEVTNWDLGIVAYDFGGAAFDASVAQCNIHDNLSYGLYSNAAETVTATCNWWGDLDGPDALGNPSAGDAISTGATYAPWLDGVGGNCVLYGDNNVGVGNAAVCLTPSNTCVTVPVTFNRLDTTESRGVSVTIQLSPELVLCTGTPNVDIAIATGAGSWSDPFGNIIHQIVDNGGGSYTIDRAILGEPCGSDHGGLLFSVNVAKAPAVAVDAVGTVSVTAVDVRDCLNAPLPGIPGAVGEVSINVTIPDVLADLTASQKKTGNDGDGTTKIDLAWTAPGGDAALIDLWRKGYGYYPEYNDGAGAVPAAPVTLGNGWTHVATVSATTTSYQDEPANRDFWYYAAFVTDECGNVSAASALTGGTLNYHLGDVVGGGDNLVNTSDMSLLGFYYGNTGIPYGDAVRNILDVGPTTNYSVNALPTTDNRIQFEDLMMFAINHDQVSKIQWPSASADVNAITLMPETPGAVGSTFDVAVVMSAKGDIQGLSAPLTWDAAVAVPVDMKPGNLLPAQGDLAMVLSPEPGTVDAAVMGVGDRGISGQGTLATITFRVVSAGDPQLGLGNVTARDNANQPVALNGGGSSLPPVTLPSMSELRANVPNPFNPSTEFSFVLSQDGPVTLRIYTMRGELVRTLLSQDMVAGPHALTWNGMNDQGRQVASGAYIVRFVAPDRTQSRHITLLK